LPEVAKLLRLRPADAHKGTMGHALLVAGSRGIAGCAVLAGEACLRSGADKLTVETPEEKRLILQTALPEAIVSTQQPRLQPYQSAGIGPGIGLDETASGKLRTTIRQADTYHIPVVVDGDALRLIGREESLLPLLAGHTVLTPHRGEMSAMACDMQLEGKTLEDCAMTMAARW
jgi:NAD(P)H-hydrate epimerase